MASSVSVILRLVFDTATMIMSIISGINLHGCIIGFEEIIETETSDLRLSSVC